MLIDNITIRVRAGNGGDGTVAFNTNLMSRGPTGADGGHGGSVYFEGVSDLNALSQFSNKKELIAEDGGKGGQQFRDGSDGKDLICKIPVGTVINTIENGNVQEILHIGERILIAKSGHGGRGNFKFRSSTNTTPKESEKGTLGEDFTIRLELKLIADIGLVGLPNAGKSSLLNELTRAKSKVANYPFTTLEPSLGVYYELILADIPGLIEGASGGKGLGIKFLQHIERTNILFHLISAESEDPARDYKIIRNELIEYNPKLGKKEEFIFLTKSDMLSADELRKKIAVLKKIKKNIIAISIHDEESLEKVKKILNTIKAKK